MNVEDFQYIVSRMVQDGGQVEGVTQDPAAPNVFLVETSTKVMIFYRSANVEDIPENIDFVWDFEVCEDKEITAHMEGNNER